MVSVRLELREYGWSTPEIAAAVAKPVIGLQCWVRFVEPNGGLTKGYRAVVDTGAPMSVLPQRIWQSVSTRILAPNVRLAGISRRKECEVPADLGEVSRRLSDAADNVSRVLRFPAYLAKTDRVPLIVGFADLLSEFRANFDYHSHEGWLEDTSQGASDAKSRGD